MNGEQCLCYPHRWSSSFMSSTVQLPRHFCKMFTFSLQSMVFDWNETNEFEACWACVFVCECVRCVPGWWCFMHEHSAFCKMIRMAAATLQLFDFGSKMWFSFVRIGLWSSTPTKLVFIKDFVRRRFFSSEMAIWWSAHWWWPSVRSLIVSKIVGRWWSVMAVWSPRIEADAFRWEELEAHLASPNPPKSVSRSDSICLDENPLPCPDDANKRHRIHLKRDLFLRTTNMEISSHSRLPYHLHDTFSSKCLVQIQSTKYLTIRRTMSQSEFDI